MPVPSTCFDPLKAPFLSRRWSLGDGTDGWPSRYLAAARAAATRDGVCSLSLMWSHARWLVRIARASRPESDAGAVSDADAVSEWFPNSRYVYVTCTDNAEQALRWYAAMHPRLSGPDGPTPDFQEVRWLETIIGRQDRSWRTFFRVHGVAAETVDLDDLRRHPARTVRSVLRSLGLRPRREHLADEFALGPIDLRAAPWIEPYRAIRPRLNATVGVRKS